MKSSFLKPIFDQFSTYGETRYLVFPSKMFEKQMWKSDILSKDAGNILLVKTNYLVST